MTGYIEDEAAGQLESVQRLMGEKEAMLPQEGQVESDIVTHQGVMAYEARERPQEREKGRSAIRLLWAYPGEALDVIGEGALGVDQAGPGV